MAETASGTIGGSQTELTEQASQNIAALHAEGDLSDIYYNRYLELKEAAEQSASAHRESIRVHEDVALFNILKKRKMKYEVRRKKEEMQLANQSLRDHYRDCISVQSEVTTVRDGSGLPSSAALDGKSKGERADDAEQKQKGDNLNERGENPSQGAFNRGGSALKVSRRLSPRVAEFYRSRAPVADPQKAGRVDNAERKQKEGNDDLNEHRVCCLEERFSASDAPADRGSGSNPNSLELRSAGPSGVSGLVAPSSK